MSAPKRHRHRAQRTRQILRHGVQATDAATIAWLDDRRTIEIAECSCGATRRTERGPWVPSERKD